jgi:hypothetical protein
MASLRSLWDQPQGRRYWCHRPSAGAAAAASTARITSSIVATFLSVQDSQLRSVEAMNQNLIDRLGPGRSWARLFRIEDEVLEATKTTTARKTWNLANVPSTSSTQYRPDTFPPLASINSPTRTDKMKECGDKPTSINGRMIERATT